MTSLLLQEGGESVQFMCHLNVLIAAYMMMMFGCVVGVEEVMESALIDIMVSAMRQAAEATPPLTRSQKKVQMRPIEGPLNVLRPPQWDVCSIVCVCVCFRI